MYLFQFNFYLLTRFLLFFFFFSFPRYNRKDRELASAQKKLADLESLVNDLQAKLADAENAKKHLESQNAVSLYRLIMQKILALIILIFTLTDSL